MADGGMAEYTVVPRNQIHTLPDAVALSSARWSSRCRSHYHAATLADVSEQSRALIYGAGPIGIGHLVRAARHGPDRDRRRRAHRHPAGVHRGARRTDAGPDDGGRAGTDRRPTDGNGVDAAFDAAGVAPAVESALDCVGERRPLISVAIYDKPLPTPLINLVLRERRIQGTICYTGDDYRAVIDLMARGHYDTTGWVDTIPLSGVIEQGFEELRAGRKMKLLVDPTL